MSKYVFTKRLELFYLNIKATAQVIDEKVDLLVSKIKDNDLTDSETEKIHEELDVFFSIIKGHYSTLTKELEICVNEATSLQTKIVSTMTAFINANKEPKTASDLVDTNSINDVVSSILSAAKKKTPSDLN